MPSIEQHSDTPEPRAYSYVRFSTPAQAHGDSYARQTDKASQYAAEHGLKLDTELKLTDKGVSGYRGTNAKKGALGAFLRAVEDKTVPKGSYLLIENLDRLSRDEINESVPLFFDIINAGVVVVTLTNGEAYSRERLRTQGWAVYMIITELLRANQESFYKGQRIADAKERNRARLAQGEMKPGQPYTRQTPGWIRWSDESRAYELIPERAEVVREIFALTDQGWGLDRIAHTLNQRGTDTWGKGERKATFWRASYIYKILHSKAAIGLFTPAKTTRDEETRVRRDVLLEPVPLFPAAVDAELFWRVAHRLETTAPRGRNVYGKPASIVAGVAKCSNCGASMIRVTKGNTSRRPYNTYLLCSRAHERAKDCEYLAVRYQDVVEALTVNAKDIIAEAPGGKDTTQIEEEIRNLDAYLTEGQFDLENLVDLAAHDRSPAATKRFREKEREFERGLKKLRELRARKDTLTPANVRARLENLQTALLREPLDVAEVNSALRQAVRKIVVDPKQARLTLHWHHSEETDDGVHFSSRHYAAFDKVPGGWVYKPNK